ncbi:DUF202 domain-containing protein [Comamonas antarctica]|nr:DUF202 domain-containing protein [Comamonas antarctica]
MTSNQDPTPPTDPTPPAGPDKPPPTQIPQVDASDPDSASLQYSQFRTGLSAKRTDMSTERTGMSRERTDMSKERTDMSKERTAMSTERTDMSTARTDMSKRRTGMSFQRTRMSADRTLMSVIRTSLSLISFGFTIVQAFEKLAINKLLHDSHATRNFGVSLVCLGIIMLAIGILYHLRFMQGLRHTREEMTENGLIHGESVFPTSFTLVTAIILLGIGVVAVLSIVLNIGPFG